MLRTTFILTAVLFLWQSPAAHAAQIALAEWEPAEGDMFIVDTENNVGYLRHAGGDFAVTYLATGQRRWVNYIGRSYNATTPQGWWVVKSTHIQSDRRTFGSSGLFMRLYKNSTEYTSYGIHSHASIDDMLLQPQRYFSMGCVLVNDYVLNLLNETYILNGEELQVITKYGVEKSLYVTE